MTQFRISEAAALLGVSDDTVRRWGEHGRLALRRGCERHAGDRGHGTGAAHGGAASGGALADAFPLARASARNRFIGLVTRVQRDGVMAQVDLQAGPFRVVSLMSREAADELGLEPGMLAAATSRPRTSRRAAARGRLSGCHGRAAAPPRPRRSRSSPRCSAAARRDRVDAPGPRRVAAPPRATAVHGAAPATLTVFAAASLTEAFDELAAQFEAEHPSVEVVLNYGGSGALAQQIVAGAPADVFASAAEPTMQTVVDAGLAADPVVFATNTLDLVVPAGNPADVAGLTTSRTPTCGSRSATRRCRAARPPRSCSPQAGRRPRRPTRSSPT